LVLIITRVSGIARFSGLMVNITTMAALTVIINFKELSLLYIDYLFA